MVTTDHPMVTLVMISDQVRSRHTKDYALYAPSLLRGQSPAAYPTYSAPKHMHVQPVFAAFTHGAGKRLSMAQQLVRWTAAVCSASDGDVGETGIAGVVHHTDIVASKVVTCQPHTEQHKRKQGIPSQLLTHCRYSEVLHMLALRWLLNRQPSVSRGSRHVHGPWATTQVWLT